MMHSKFHVKRSKDETSIITKEKIEKFGLAIKSPETLRCFFTEHALLLVIHWLATLTYHLTLPILIGMVTDCTCLEMTLRLLPTPIHTIYNHMWYVHVPKTYQNRPRNVATLN